MGLLARLLDLGEVHLEVVVLLLAECELSRPLAAGLRYALRNER